VQIAPNETPFWPRLLQESGTLEAALKPDSILWQGFNVAERHIDVVDADLEKIMKRALRCS
jgi:hypothetical protein